MESCVNKAILWQRALRDDGVSYTIFSGAQNLPTDLLLYFRMSKGFVLSHRIFKKHLPLFFPHLK